MPDQQIILLDVGRDDRSMRVYPGFANFLQVSRVGTEVQLEFLFVDVNQLALTLEKAKEAASEGPHKLSGLSVAKVVMPALNFVQQREHVNAIFDAIEKDLGKVPSGKEVQHGVSPVVAT